MIPTQGVGLRQAVVGKCTSSPPMPTPMLPLPAPGSGQCVGEVSVYQQGSAHAQAAALLLTPAVYRTRTVTICGSRQESVVEGAHDTRNVAWSLDRNQAGRRSLTMTDNEITGVYEKVGFDPDLADAWHIGPVFSTNFYDPATQVFTTPEADGLFLHIAADGSYVSGEFGHSVDQQNCQLTGWVYQEGTVEVSGSRLTLTPTTGMARVENACQPDQPQQQPWHDDAQSFTWFIRDYPADPNLTIIPLAMYREYNFVRSRSVAKTPRA